jgi:hypothetical protein
LCVDIGAANAINKTGQALREDATDIRHTAIGIDMNVDISNVHGTIVVVPAKCPTIAGNRQHNIMNNVNKQATTTNFDRLKEAINQPSISRRKLQQQKQHQQQMTGQFLVQQTGRFLKEDRGLWFDLDIGGANADADAIKKKDWTSTPQGSSRYYDRVRSFV